MNTILIIDVDPQRARLISDLLKDHNVPSILCRDMDEIHAAMQTGSGPAVIVAHCALVNYTFTELAVLSSHPNVKLIFYCTDADQRPSSDIARLPDELTQILLKITETKKVQKKVS